MIRAGFRNLLALAIAIPACAAWGSGFALYEGSAAGVALGGGVLGKAVDASALFYNPATMTDFTNTVITLGFVTEHPTADTSVNGRHDLKLNPGCFVLPHVYLVQPITSDLSFGLGFAPEYGLGSAYDRDWALSWNTRDTTIEGLSINPNVAYKVTDDWTVAAGLRFMWLSFDQTSYRRIFYNGSYYGSFRDKLEGNNGLLDWGWEISTKYRVTDRLSVGAVYKSYIDCHLKGHNRTHMESYDDDGVSQLANYLKYMSGAEYSPGVPYSALPLDMIRQGIYRQFAEGVAGADGDASAKVRLPASVAVGANYDLTEDIDFGLSLTWTQWSSLRHIYFNLPNGNSDDLYLGWRDTYRVGGGVSWRFAENWKWMGSYTYDVDPCRKRYGSTMLPAGDRHIVSTGLSYRWGNWEITGCYSIVLMSETSTVLHDRAGDAFVYDTHNGISHAAGVTISYFF